MKMKVLVLLACFGACSAQYLLTTSRNLGSSNNAPSFQSSLISYSAPSIQHSQPSNSYGAPIVQRFDAPSNSVFRSGASSGGNSEFSGFGGNSGYSSGGNDVRRVSSIHFGNIGGGSGHSSGGPGFSRSIGGNSVYSSGFSSRHNNFASNNQNSDFSSGSSGHGRIIIVGGGNGRFDSYFN